MSDEELADAAMSMRATAAPVGSMHALWDLIFDIETLIQGRASLLSREKVEAQVIDYLKQWKRV